VAPGDAAGSRRTEDLPPSHTPQFVGTSGTTTPVVCVRSRADPGRPRGSPAVVSKEMWIHGVHVDIGPFDGEFEFGHVGRSVFEFVENCLRNEYLSSQFEQ
jgi:hypothetical protein